MNWREILPKAKAERDKLQKQANEIEEKINRLDREIFDAEQGIKKMDEREEMIKKAEWKDPLEESEVEDKQC